MEEKIMGSVYQARQDSYCPVWKSPATNTATSVGTAEIEPEDFADTIETARKPSAWIGIHFRYDAHYLPGH
jgi:hypothetical protein